MALSIWSTSTFEFLNQAFVYVMNTGLIRRSDLSIHVQYPYTDEVDAYMMGYELRTLVKCNCRVFLEIQMKCHIDPVCMAQLCRALSLCSPKAWQNCAIQTRSMWQAFEFSGYDANTGHIFEVHGSFVLPTAIRPCVQVATRLWSGMRFSIFLSKEHCDKSNSLTERMQALFALQIWGWGYGTAGQNYFWCISV